MTGGELIIVLAAVVVGAVIKSVTGMGLPIIVVPIATLFVDLADAVVVIAVPNLAANAALLWRERHHLDQTRDLPTLLATGIVGGVLGALAFVNLPEEPLLVLLVAAIALYLGRSLLQPDARLAPATTARWAPAVGTVAGLFQGGDRYLGPDRRGVDPQLPARPGSPRRLDHRPVRGGRVGPVRRARRLRPARRSDHGLRPGDDPDPRLDPGRNLDPGTAPARPPSIGPSSGCWPSPASASW